MKKSINEIYKKIIKQSKEKFYFEDFFISNEVNAKYHDIKSWVVENESIKERTFQILENAGVNRTLIKNKFLVASDFYLTPQQAIDYGVIDHILER